MLLTKVPMIEVTRFGKKRKLIFDFEINTKCITSWEYQKNLEEIFKALRISRFQRHIGDRSRARNLETIYFDKNDMYEGNN